MRSLLTIAAESHQAALSTSDAEKPVIACFKDTFFVRSETFIYNYLVRLKRFRPILLAGEFNHLDEFPFPQASRFTCPLPDGRWQKVIDRIRGQFFNDRKTLYNTLKEQQVVLIHAHFGPSGYAMLLHKRRLNIPLVTNFYGYDMSQLSQEIYWRKAYKTLFHEGDLFLVEGAFMEKQLQAMGCPEHKIMIQRIAIPVSRIPFVKRQPKKNGDNVRILFCGRFVEKKGVIILLEAVKQVWEKRQGFELVLIGEGPLKEPIEDFIKQNDLSSCVRLEGFINYDHYIEALAQADIFAHPSVRALDGDSEGGAPTTILEAQASGLPVIATRHADIPNVVVPGKSALLAEERDVEMLERYISFMLDNPLLWSQFGTAGRQFVEAYHDIDKESLSLEEKYGQLLQRKMTNARTIASFLFSC